MPDTCTFFSISHGSHSEHILFSENCIEPFHLLFFMSKSKFDNLKLAVVIDVKFN